jgi:nicotinamidase-related amidase
VQLARHKLEPDLSQHPVSPLDPLRTAVLSLDIQTALVAIYTKHAPEFLPTVASVVAHCRKVRANLLHVRVGFRPGFPEVSERNLFLAAMKSNPQHRQIFEGEFGAIHAAVAPESEEVVITKHRVSAFHGTDLSVLLRSKEIDTLVLFGIATSGVVLSTALEATDLDYHVFVVSDCCADLDPDVHSCVLDKLLSRRTTVLTAAELIDKLN